MVAVRIVVNKSRVKYSIQLPATLHETSGLVLTTICSGRLMTIRIQRFTVDTTGVIQKKVALKKWSTKTGRRFHKTTYFLYWDFGNVSGNRKDLHILRIEKNRLHWMFQRDTLSFSYSDQTDFRNQSPTPATLTVKLLCCRWQYLLIHETVETKERLCTHYQKLNHVAQLKESYNIKELITETICPPKLLLKRLQQNAVPIYLSFIRLQQQQFLFRQ
jgi:hypothetical protein